MQMTSSVKDSAQGQVLGQASAILLQTALATEEQEGGGEVPKLARTGAVHERPEPEAHPDSVNARLAVNLYAHRDEIINEWLERVRGDPAIPTGTLTTEALKNHLPQLFDDLAETLRHYGSDRVAKQSGKDAENHGATRWRQGYELPEMLREIKHLRAILIHHLRVFEEMNQDFGLAARLFISSTLHLFLDELGIEATEQFLNEGGGKSKHLPFRL